MPIDWKREITWSICRAGSKKVAYKVKLTCRQVLKVIYHNGKRPDQFARFERLWGGHRMIYFEINRQAYIFRWKRKWRPDLLVPVPVLPPEKIDFIMNSKLSNQEIADRVGCLPHHIPYIRLGQLGKKAMQINNNEEFSA